MAKDSHLETSREIASPVFYHEGIIVDEKGNISLSKEAIESLQCYIEEVRSNIPEVQTESSELTEETAQEVLDTLAIKHKPEKKIEKFINRMQTILSGKKKDTPKLEKTKKIMKKEAHTPSVHINIEYTPISGGRSQLPTGIIIRKDKIPVERILHSLQTRCNFTDLLSRKHS